MFLEISPVRLDYTHRAASMTRVKSFQASVRRRTRFVRGLIRVFCSWEGISPVECSFQIWTNRVRQSFIINLTSRHCNPHWYYSTVWYCFRFTIYVNLRSACGWWWFLTYCHSS
jgi:hypothetical protein